MIQINSREIAQLTDAERSRSNVQRFIGEQSAWPTLMAARVRRRARRAAIDEAENDGECQVPPDLQDMPVD